MIYGELVILRALEDKDISQMRAWRNDPGLMPYHFNHLPVSEAGQRRWYDTYTGDSGTIVFIVELKDHTPIGYTIIKNIDYKNRNAEVGLHVDPAYQGKGYGKDAFRTLIRYGFHELNLHRIYLEVFAFNEKAIQLYQKLGFKTDGCLREAYFTQNRYHDILVMSILAKELFS